MVSLIYAHPIAAAHISNTGGVLIYGFEYGINDYVIASLVYTDEETQRRKCRIEMDINGTCYFLIDGWTTYLEELVKLE